MDLKLDKEVESSGKYNSPTLKCCSGCHTTKTPLWRGGPAGPKSLCNACGIKYHKKRRQLLGLDTGKPHEKKKRSNVVRRSSDARQHLKTRFMLFGRDLSVLGRPGKLVGELREEERAAMVLMALSGGSVYA